MLAAPACSKSHAQSRNASGGSTISAVRIQPRACVRPRAASQGGSRSPTGTTRARPRRSAPPPAAKCRAPRARRAGRARARSTSPGSPCGRRGPAAPLMRPAGRRRRPRRRRERPRQVALGMAHLLGEVAQLVEAEIREEDERGGAGHAGEPVGRREEVGSRPPQGVAGLRGGRPDQRVDAGAGDDAGRRRGSRAPQGYRRLTPGAP